MSFGRMDERLFLVIIVEIVDLIDLMILREVDEKNCNDTLITFEEELGTVVIGLLMLFKLKKSPSIKCKNKRSFECIIYLFILRLTQVSEKGVGARPIVFLNFFPFVLKKKFGGGFLNVCGN